MVKSPKLTADWENALALTAKGEYSMQEFMGGIEDMVKGLVQTQPGKKYAGGETTLVKGLKGKKGSYDAYLIPEGVKEYSYTKDRKEIKGSLGRLSHDVF